MAYIVPEAWARYNRDTKLWSGWHTQFGAGGYSLYARTNDTEGTEDRLCFRFRIDKNVVRKYKYAQYKIRNYEDTQARLRVCTYGFDPTTYGQYLPSGELYAADATDTDRYFVMRFGGSTQPLDTTSEYFYGLIYNRSPAGVQPPYIFVEPISLLQPYSLIADQAELYDPELSLSSTSVTTGSSFTSTITKRGDRTVRIVVMYGNTELVNHTGDNDMVSIPADKSWFTTAGVTSLASINLSVRLQIQENGVWTTKATKNLTLNAGSDMNPVIGGVSTEVIQPAPANVNYPGIFIKGISKARFTVTAEAGSNAAIQSVIAEEEGGNRITLELDSQTGKYIGTSDPINGGRWTFVVTDQRGMKKSMTANPTENAYDYVKPSLSVNSSKTYRCTQDGTKDNTGTYFSAFASADYDSGIPNNSIVSFDVNGTPLTPLVQSEPIATSYTSSQAMLLTFSIRDRVGYSSSAYITLPPGGKSILVHVAQLNDGTVGTTIGIGKEPEIPMRYNNLNKIDVAVPYNGIYGEWPFQANGMNANGFFTSYGTARDGMSFQKDFSNINLANPISRENATACFRKEAEDGVWSGFPAEISGKEWIGIRFVFVILLNMHGIVVVLETVPVSGRIWTRKIGSGGAGAWVHIDPQT